MFDVSAEVVAAGSLQRAGNVRAKSRPTGRPALGVVFAIVAAGSVSAQLRVATWNVSNYETGRVGDFQTAIYGVFEGRSFAPDVIIAQEMVSEAGLKKFLKLLNDAKDGPDDWDAAPFVDGPDTDCAFFYRTSRLELLGYTVVSEGGDAPQHPRNLMRYDVRLRGYSGDGSVVACYGSHMKSGSRQGDRDRRELEATKLRENAAALNPEWRFIAGADLNIDSASETAYQILVGDDGGYGRFWDPIATPASWHNNEEYRFIHTQDPTGAGGMDDRFDQILVCAALIDGDGFDYIGDPTRPYDDSTWDDPHHSYRAWGNDGTSFNQSLTVEGNTMVGATIAQALVNCATKAGGHIPVFLDLRVPPVVASDEVIDFGRVPPGWPAERELSVWNSGDVALWSENGIAALRYTMAASEGFAAPEGTFEDAAGGDANRHVIGMDTSTRGEKSGVLTITSNAPDEPERWVILIGEVGYGRGDMDCSGAVDFDDIDPFVLALVSREEYEAQYPDCDYFNADVNEDQSVDFGDLDPFVECLVDGCD